MNHDSASWFFFNGTYNFSMEQRRHIHPREALGYWPDKSEYIPTSIGKTNTFESLDLVMERLDQHGAVVVFCGTDNIEELAFLFSINRPKDSVIVFVGAMWPFGHPQYDAVTSLQTLIRKGESLGSGSWVVVNKAIYDGYLVRKCKSVGECAFSPLATLGESDEYMTNAPPPIKCIRPGSIHASVPILFVGLASRSDQLIWDDVHGIVVAGSGTGSIPKNIAETLAVHASRIPVVVSTRCMEGPNNAEELYPGSVGNYEKLGFRIRGYSGLNPLQARLKLMVELSGAVK